MSKPQTITERIVQFLPTTNKSIREKKVWLSHSIHSATTQESFLRQILLVLTELVRVSDKNAGVVLYVKFSMGYFQWQIEKELSG